MKESLTEEFKNKLMETIKKDPKKAIREIEKNPQIIKILLTNDNKIKYVNMTPQMQMQLKNQAKRLKVSQGILIGMSIKLILSLLDSGGKNDT